MANGVEKACHRVSFLDRLIQKVPWYSLNELFPVRVFASRLNLVDSLVFAQDTGFHGIKVDCLELLGKGCWFRPFFSVPFSVSCLSQGRRWRQIWCWLLLWFGITHSGRSECKSVRTKSFFLGPKMRINRVLAELKIYDFSWKSGVTETYHKVSSTLFEQIVCACRQPPGSSLQWASIGYQNTIKTI